MVNLPASYVHTVCIWFRENLYGEVYKYAYIIIIKMTTIDCCYTRADYSCYSSVSVLMHGFMCCGCIL